MFEKGIAVIGSTTIDENILKTGSWHKIGGATTYCGITYRRHGIETYIISNIARQDTQVTAALEREKIIVSSGNTTHTTQFINDVTKSERRQKMPFKSAPIIAGHVKRIINRVSCIHLGPLHPMDIDPAAIVAIKYSKLPVVLDVQGYTRRIEGEDITTAVSKRLSSAMMISQIVKTNEAELETILGFYGLDTGGLIKAHNIEECVVTRGEKGGFVQNRNGSVYPYKALQIDTALDSTGAGDVFLAAYTVGRFLNRWNIADACGYAALLSARQINGDYITQEAIGLKGQT